MRIFNTHPYWSFMYEVKTGSPAPKIKRYKISQVKVIISIQDAF